MKKKLGEYPAMIPEQARILAKEIKASAVLGKDIIAENRAKIEAEKKAKAAIVTVKMAVEEY